MKKGKIIGIIILIIIIIAGFCIYSHNKKEQVKEVSLTYVTAPLNVPSIVEKNEQMFTKEYAKKGINVKYYDITSGSEQTAALASGNLDFLNAVGGTSAILAASNGVNLKILSVYSRAPQGFVIVTKDKSIKSVKDLKGLKIGGPKGTILNQLLVAALKKNNMNLKDVDYINMGIPEAMAALDNGSIKAALLAGPAALKAEESGAHVICDGKGLISGLIVTAVNENFAKAHPDLVNDFLKVQKQAVDYINQNTDKALEQTSKVVGLTKAQTEKMYSWYNFNPTITQSDITALEKTQDFLINSGMQTNRIDIPSLIYHN